MAFFTFLNGRSLRRAMMVLLCLGFASTEFLPAQTEPGAVPAPFVSTNGAPAMVGDTTNGAPVGPVILSPTPSASSEQPSLPLAKPPALTGTDSITDSGGAGELPVAGWTILAALMTLASLGG